MIKIKKKDIKPLFVLLAIIGVLLLLSQTNVLQSIFIECQNIEPTTINEYAADFRSMETGSLSTYNQVYIVTPENNSIVLQQYSSISEIGDLVLTDCAILSCDYVINQFAVARNSSFVTLNNKKVLNLDSGYMWCNEQDTVLLEGDGLQTFSNYWEKYEICSYTEQLDTTNTTDGEDSTTDTYSSSTSDTSTSVVSSPSFDSASITTTGTDDYDRVIAFAIILIIASIIIWYWFFERGSKKGFIKSTKNKTRR